MHRGQHRRRHTSTWARQGHRLQFGQRGHARDLFDQIGFALNIAPPRGHPYFDHIACPRGREAKRGQDTDLFFLRDFHPDKADHAFGVQGVAARGFGRSTRLDNLGGFATAKIKDHLGCGLKTRTGVFRINAALETVARIGIDLQITARIGDLDHVPIGAFKENIDRLFGTAAFLAAHDARDAFRATIIRDDHMARLEAIGLFIQRQHLLAALSAVYAQIALHLIGIKDVQRTVLVIGEEIGHIHQGRDRAQADSAQTVLQPCGRGAVLDATDHAAYEMRCNFEGILGNADTDWAGEAACNLAHLIGFQTAKTARGQIAGHTAHPKRILTVWRNGDLDHGVDLGGVIRGQPVDEFLTHLA